MSRSGHGLGCHTSAMLSSTGQMSVSSQGQRVRSSANGSTRRAERGTSLVEFALVSIIFFGLVFAIISYGVALSFKQTLTQATNEAARAAAVVEDIPTTAGDERVLAAQATIRQFEAYGKNCQQGPTTCTISVHDCTTGVALPDCITVTVTYPYRSNPIVPSFPLLGVVLPNSITSTATAQLSFPG